MAAEAGLANARFVEADLAELDAAASARLLPEVDIVICHGVWTWVPDAVRQGIVALLRSRLKPGGLLLIGYNALPGYADCIAMQRVLFDSVRDMPGSDKERGAHALAVLDRLRMMGSPYLPPPGLLDRLMEPGRAAPAYMAHEWFTPFWRPVFHADLARELAAAGLEFGGAAQPGRSLPGLQLGEAQHAAAAAMPAGMDRETVTDALLHRRFRSDIFVRGRRPGGLRQLGRTVFALAVDPAAAELRLGTQRGFAGMPAAAQDAILGALATGPKPLGELAALPGTAGMGAAEIAVMLAETGTALPLWREVPPGAAAAARAAACNATLFGRFRDDAFGGKRPLGVVVPALGSAIAASLHDLAVVVALQSGLPAEPEAIAARIGADPQGAAAARTGIEASLRRNLSAWRGLGIV
jgi:hypothetical protein